MRRILQIGRREQEVWLEQTLEGHVLHVGERALSCSLAPAGRKGAYVLTLQGQRFPLRIAVGEAASFIHLDGRAYEIGLVDPVERLVAGNAGASQHEVRAPMPGVVVSVNVAPGDSVLDGQPLMVIESMKLETTLCAPRDGIVAELPFAAGDKFGLKAILARLEPVEEG